MTLQDKIDAYLETRVAYDVIHAESSALYAQHQGAKAALVDAMLEEEKQAVKFGEGELKGMSFFLKNVFSVSCTEANNDECIEWLQEKYGDAAEFTVERVNKRLLEEKLKTDIEGEELDEFDVPDFMKLKTRPDVSCTGYKQFSANRRQ
jgi:hypothetical protein